MKPVRIGRLRKRVTIEAVTQTISSDGQPIEAWEDAFGARWANVEPIITSGREYVHADAILADVTHTVKLRFFEGVTPKHRVNYGGRILEIQSVADVEERGRMLVLVCKEII